MKTLIVYVHLITACTTFGILLFQDLVLVVMGYLEYFQQYLFNEKLWAKYTLASQFVMSIYGTILFGSLIVAGAVLHNIHRKEECELSAKFHY